VLGIGDQAPRLRLPSLTGPEVGLEDYRGRKNVVVWFTKGFACVFCRRQMIQMRRDYPRIQALDAEILEVTPTRPDRARVYAAHFPVPFPYLLDPPHSAWPAWGLGRRSHGPGYYVKGLLSAVKMEQPPASEVGAAKPSLAEIPGLLADDDMGLFVVDRDGIVRYAMAGSYDTVEDGRHQTRSLPSTAEILRVLESCRR